MGPLPTLLIHAPNCAAARVEKVAGDLARAYGVPPERRAARHALEDPGDHFQVVCRLSAEAQAIGFGEIAYGGLSISLGPDEPGEAKELSAAEAFAWQAADGARLLLERWIEGRIGAGSKPVVVCTHNWRRPVADAALELRVLERRFRFHGPLLVSATPDSLESWAAIAGRDRVLSSEQGLDGGSVAALVVLTDGPDKEPAPAFRPLLGHCPCYLFRTPELLRLERFGERVVEQVDLAANRHLRHNQFIAGGDGRARLGEFETPTGKAFAFSNGLGPYNPFGHRIGGRIAALGERGDDHLLVAFFGGSGVFSPRCFQDETLPGSVSQILNQASTAGGGSDEAFTRATVLNFGIQAGTITDALANLAHFGSLARPDIVVAHLGANEFGSFEDDSALLGDFGLFYPTQYGRGEIGKPVTRNDAAALATALAERLDAFRLLARGLGAAVILGLQPSFIFKAPTALEAEVVERAFQRLPPQFLPHVDLAWNLYSRGLPLLRAWAESCAAEHADFRLLDLTGAFAANESAFYDHVHLTPDGNRRIGASYAEAITDLLARPRPQQRRPAASPVIAETIRPTRKVALEASLETAIAAAESNPDLAKLARLLRNQRDAIVKAAYRAEEPDKQVLSRLNYPLD